MNRDDEDNEIDARLGALPRPALDAVAGARIHARSRAAFLAGHATRTRWSTRALESIAVAAVVVGYLVWTANALAAIDWGRTLAR